MSKKRDKYIVIFIMIALFTIIIFNLVPASDISLKIMGLIGIVQLIYSIYSWTKLTGIVYSPYVIFLVAAYVFTFGQSLLYVFDAVSPNRDLTKSFTFDQIYPAQELTLIFLIFFHIGALLSLNFKSTLHFEQRIPEDIQNKYIKNQIIGIKLIGKIFVIISIIPYLMEIISMISIVQASGYGGIYNQEAKIGIDNIFGILADYFIPGVLCLLVVERRNKYKLIWLTILLLNILYWMYIGGRSNGVILASIFLLYYHNYIKPIRFKQFATFSIIGYFFISFLSAVGETRSDKSSSAIEVFTDNLGKNDAFFDAISEMGGSMMPMIASYELVPNTEDYKYGSSYMFSLTSVIPNLGFWDLHPAMKYGNLNKWLQDKLNLNYGPGFSIVAEAYVNFGVFGFILMFILGYILGLIFRIDIKNIKNPLLFVLSIILCYLVIKTVRNSFLATVRSLAYYILPIYLVVRYVKNGRLIYK